VKRGERLLLLFGPDGRAGRAPVVCTGHYRTALRVLRVTRQRHESDHAATHFRTLLVTGVRLRRPTEEERQNFADLWAALETEIARRERRSHPA